MDYLTFLPTLSDEDKNREFPCSCQGPSVYARSRVYEALKEMFDKNPTPLPPVRSGSPLLLRHYTTGCKCLKDYADLTVRLLRAISLRNTATTDKFDAYNQDVRNLLHYFYRTI